VKNNSILRGIKNEMIWMNKMNEEWNGKYATGNLPTSDPDQWKIGVLFLFLQMILTFFVMKTPNSQKHENPLCLWSSRIL